ncbi:MAG: right-handed parallel beta-helix repeat-containing protein [Phycisphaerae bacterium]
MMKPLNDVWAVGRYVNPSQPTEALTAHWDGSTWTKIPNPERSVRSKSILDRRAVVISTAIAAIVGTIGPLALAQTITVDISDADVIDIDPNTATVADLPGPDGHISFSEAMIASNNTPGRQTVGFAIPTSEWTYLPWYYPGRAVITGMMFYANAYDTVTIDGTTQTAFTGDTNPDGWEVVILRGGGLYFPADNCRVTGLDRTSVYFEGSSGVVENNSLMGVNIYGGSGGAGTIVKGNAGGGYVQIDQSNDNVVIGSTFDRVRVLGWIAGGRPATNNRIGGPALAERNHIIGLGTLNSQGIPSGFAIQLFDSIGTIIENNWIGTKPDGLTQGHPYTTSGIYFDTENYDTVIRNNRIAGILATAVPPHGPSYSTGVGIELYGAGSGVTVVGNKIGLDANDQPTLGSVTGIMSEHYFYPNGIQNVRIGGSTAGEGNEIAGQLGAGISVANTYTGVRISGNSIHDNGGLGIDLITADFLAGVTPNDSLDADAGGNGLQNFPVLAAAASNGVITSVQGAFNSLANQAFTLEFFASPTCDPAGFGEGKTYVGSVVITTDGAGNASFSTTLSAGVPAGSVITATAAQNSTRNTSEFSACVTVAPAANPPGDIDGDGRVNESDLGALLSAFGRCNGAPGYNAAADFDHSGCVNESDLGVLLSNWTG